MRRAGWVLLISVLFALFAGAPVLAENEILTADPAPMAPSSGVDEILLKDGTLLQGKIIEERDDIVVFETVSLGRLEIRREQIERLAHHGDSSGAIQDPDENSIMFCPTPATLPKGDFYFRSFELFFLNFGYGVTDNFDLSFGTLFPISSDVFLLSFGGKLRILDRDTSPLGLALTASYSSLEEQKLVMAGAVIGIGDASKGLNLAVNYTADDDDEEGTTFLVGGDIQAGQRTKLFAEYFNSALVLGDDEDLTGFINLGVRWFSRNHSFSLSAFRPLVEDSGSFIAFPMVMYSHHW